MKSSYFFFFLLLPSSSSSFFFVFLLLLPSSLFLIFLLLLSSSLFLTLNSLETESALQAAAVSYGDTNGRKKIKLNLSYEDSLFRVGPPTPLIILGQISGNQNRIGNENDGDDKKFLNIGDGEYRSDNSKGIFEDTDLGDNDRGKNNAGSEEESLSNILTY